MRILYLMFAALGGPVVSTSDCYAGGVLFSILPLLKHACVEVSSGHAGHQEVAGVIPEVNLREHISYMPPLSVNKVAYSGFETQRRHYQKSKTGVSVTPQKGLLSSKKIFKKKMFAVYSLIFFACSLIFFALAWCE